MMKKLISALIVACMLTTAFALAEGSLFTSGATEQKLEAMIPVLDSLAMSLKVTEDEEDAEMDGEDAPLPPTYSAADNDLVWTQLTNLAADWMVRNPEYAQVDAEEGVALIPGTVMDACATASFQGMLIAPMQPDTPEDDPGLVYDQQEDVYVVTLRQADPQPHYLVIERNAQDGDEMVVNCGLYETETERRLGGMTARMTDAEPDAMYPYAVSEAHAERSDDFNGLWANYCEIRYPEPEVVAAIPAASTTPRPMPTVKPSPTPTARTSTVTSTSGSSSGRSSSSSSSSDSGTSYRRLSQGSTGDDVKALQEQLNRLGYNCGTADGIYGNATISAVKYFQEAIGKSQDGVATADIQKKLFSTKAPEYVEYSRLKKGSKGSRVESLQKRLRDLGYTAHPVDGHYDSRIKEAVALFQRTAHLEDDGVATSETQKALYASTAPRYDHLIDLEKGDSGDRVYEMQLQLVYLGYLSKANEKYDSKTVDAVKAFKRDAGISGNGKSVKAWVIELMFDVGTAPSPTEIPEVVDTTVPVEETPTTETPAEQTPTEQTPAEQTPAEQTPVEQTPAEQTPAEQTPVEQTPVEQAPAEQTPAEQTPVEQAPVEQPSVEQAPEEQAPAEPAPAEPAPAEENSEKTHEEPPAEENSEKTHEEPPAEESSEKTQEEAPASEGE